MELGVTKRICTMLWVLVAAMSFSARAQQIEVKGLFNGSALLVINGQQRLLKAGKTSPEGVKLITSNSKYADVEIGGERQRLTLSRRVGGTYKPPEITEVRLPSGRHGHYWSQGRINGRSTQFMVDTGASSVAMSSVEARRLGIDYKSGSRGWVSTAGGNKQAYRVTLASVSLGMITLNGVEASIIEGNSPREVLLGNSFLRRVDMKVEQGVLVLTARQ